MLENLTGRGKKGAVLSTEGCELRAVVLWKVLPPVSGCSETYDFPVSVHCGVYSLADVLVARVC